jgi:hypothetical protein
MQISNIFNSTSTVSLFSDFQKIREEQLENCTRRLEYATGHRTPSNPPLSKAAWQGVIVFQDANVRIHVADRSDPNSMYGDRLSQVNITCMRTLQAISITDKDLADELYNKFLEMAENKEFDCKIEDFTDARKNLLKMLLFDWLYAMLYGTSDEQSQRPVMTDNQTVTETIADDIIDSKIKDIIAEFLEKNGLQMTCRKILDGIISNFMGTMQKINHQIQPNIQALSEEEISQVELKPTEALAATKAYTDNLWANLDD